MIPRAFRIRDFRSIVDSGICPLSGDNITVLAGQNEAGKTAILSALRDFDLAEGDSPKTPEFIPEGKYDTAISTVAIEFEANADEIFAYLGEENLWVPAGVFNHLRQNRRFWVERNLLTNKFSLDKQLITFWEEAKPIKIPGAQNVIQDASETAGAAQVDTKRMLEPS